MNKLFTSLALALLAAPLCAQVEPELKAGDHSKLGKQIAKWVEATIEGDTTAASEALMDLDKVVAGIDKKLKGRSALSLVADWSLAISAGRSYATSGKTPDGDYIKKGSIQEVDLAGWGTASIRIPAKYEPKKVNYPVIMLVCDTPTATIETMSAEVLDNCIILAPHIQEMSLELLMKDEGKSLFLLPLGRASRDFRIDRARLFMVAEGEKGIDFASRYVAVLPYYFAGLATVAGSCGDFPGKANLSLVEHGEHVDVAAATEWCMTAAARNPYPTEFVVELTEPWMGRAYWAQAIKFDPIGDVPAGKVARMKVAVDRSTNTITIDGEYVYQVMLFLNDVIVDLDQPITLMRNGKSLTYQASRSVGTMMGIFGANIDDTVFPASIRRIDLPIVEGETGSK